MKESHKKNIFRACPVQWILLALALGWIGFYFAFRSNQALMNTICQSVVRPWHRWAGKVTNAVPFSVAECLIALALLAALCFLVQGCICLVKAIRKKARLRRFVRWLVTLLLVVTLIFGLFSLWWGVFYYSDDFLTQAGIQRREITTEELFYATVHYAMLANEYAESFSGNREDILNSSSQIYTNTEEIFPCLTGNALRAKPIYFSKVMSLIQFTGFFFPFTAEANVNNDSPVCLLPSTIAHELAHQRGVAGEDQANFVAVLCCENSDNPDYIYSGALLAYIYLGNALYRANYDAWEAVYSILSDEVREDLSNHADYWDQYEGKAAEVSEKVYTQYLEIYGDDRGMQSYGECVDLIVAYYIDHNVL